MDREGSKKNWTTIRTSLTFCFDAASIQTDRHRYETFERFVSRTRAHSIVPANSGGYRTALLLCCNSLVAPVAAGAHHHLPPFFTTFSFLFFLPSSSAAFVLRSCAAVLGCHFFQNNSRRIASSSSSPPPAPLRLHASISMLVIQLFSIGHLRSEHRC